MKRSTINTIIENAAETIARHGFVLPPFGRWTPDEFIARKAEAGHIIASNCGWAMTDFGSGDFDRQGLCLFTLRSGLLDDLRRGRGMCYGEKLIVMRQDQVAPPHTHVIKAEDIINRGGATLVVQLHGSDDQGGLAPDRGGQVWCDGLVRAYAPGECLRLAPGESVTLRPGDWHSFWAEGGDVLAGEVSTVNDEATDNIFVTPFQTLPPIAEDFAPTHLLVSDYRAWLG